MTERDFYYCIKTSGGESVFLHTDIVEITPHGDLICRSKDGVNIDLALAAGQWNYIRAASVLTGGLCENVEHWHLKDEMAA